MAYFGYIPSLIKHLADLPRPPSVLEVGVDRGITFLPLLAAMCKREDGFLLIGVDVRLQEHVRMIVDHMRPLSGRGQAALVEGNSLHVLPELVKQGRRFDVVLLDGDHNYHTVSRELEHLDALLAPGGVAVLDDYNGRWSVNDLWYSEREEYAGNLAATKRVETEKRGVKAAVDDFVAASAGAWTLSKPMPGEPVVLTRRGEVELA